MAVSLGADYVDFNTLLREIKVRFLVVGSVSSHLEGMPRLVYAFPNSNHRMRVNNSISFPHGGAHHAFQHSWAPVEIKNPHITFDCCSPEAASDFADVKSWPVFVEVQRLMGSSSFCFKQVPIHVTDISGKIYILGHSDPTQSRDLNNLKAKFKHEVLCPMIESIREDYFTEHVAEAHAVSVRLTQAWSDIFRLAGSPGSAYVSIQRLRKEKPIVEHDLVPGVIARFPNNMRAILYATSHGPALLKDRAKIHFSFDLSDSEQTYNDLKRLIHSIQQARLKDDNTAPVTKRRQIILQESLCDQDQLP